MGLFGGSSRSTTSTTQTSIETTNITNIDNRQDNRKYIDNSVDIRETNNIDARQDNRTYIDNSVRSTTNIDASQDNRQYNDNRQDNRQYNDNRQDNSITVAQGGYYAENGNIEITEIDNDAVEAAFDFADDNARLLAEQTDKLVSEALEQSQAIADDAFNIVNVSNAALQSTTLEALDAAYDQSEAAFLDQSQKKHNDHGRYVSFDNWRGYME